MRHCIYLSLATLVIAGACNRYQSPPVAKDAGSTLPPHASALHRGNVSAQRPPANETDANRAVESVQPANDAKPRDVFVVEALLRDLVQQKHFGQRRRVRQPGRKVVLDVDVPDSGPRGVDGYVDGNRCESQDYALRREWPTTSRDGIRPGRFGPPKSSKLTSLLLRRFTSST